MHVQYSLLAGALWSALAPVTLAQTTPGQLPEIQVTASSVSDSSTRQFLQPAKVLSGNEFQEKRGTSLGETLAQELGVSASAFGSGASRPILRGMAGPRVEILQNGMQVNDLSGLSDDHAVAADFFTAQQIQILRGPAALLYGSGAIGGLINIVNQRIPSMLSPTPSSYAELRLSSVDQGQSLAVNREFTTGNFAWHIDAAARASKDYRIPNAAVLNDPSWSSRHLDNSFTRQKNLGLGASYIANWGYIGASLGVLDDHYGIPTAEKSFIDLRQNRYDLAGQIDNPVQGFESFQFKLGATDYQHTEKQEDGTPNTRFKNRAIETRWELTHLPLKQWRGTFGLQTSDSDFSALAVQSGLPDTVPQTQSRSLAVFLLEEREFGPLRANLGARLENMKYQPDAQSGSAKRDFHLGSYALGGTWNFMPGYALGTTFSLTQRAPAIEELYSNGPHESSASFDIGDENLNKERSRNLELSLQKTSGLVRWKTNLFRNRVQDFIYGRTTGTTVDDNGVADPNGQLTQRFWSQANATIRGAEAEISYNWQGEGLSLRGFTDTTRGTLDAIGNLPLQPAARIGGEVIYQQGAWRSGMAVIHGYAQNRLASFETTSTPAYTQVDLQLSYTQRYPKHSVTWFSQLKNALNEDIRLATSLLKDVAPLPGRNLLVGIRSVF